MNSLVSHQDIGDRSDVDRTRAIYLALGMAVLAAAAYTLLRQDTTHQFDTYWMLPRLRDGLTHYPRHPLAFPLLDGFVGLLDGWGSLHERLKIVSGICVGVAVGVFTHAAFVLSRDLRVALLVGLTYAALPSTVRFATIAEIHGLFLPFAAVAIWYVCRLVASPSQRGPWSGLALGLSTAIAAGVHGTGHLLVGVVGVWLLVEWRHANQAPRKIAAALLALIGAHLAASQLITWGLLVHGATTMADAQLASFDFRPDTIDGVADGMVAMVYGELLWPFLPVSVLWPLALCFSPRRLAVVFALCLPAYLATCQLLLCLPTVGYLFHENGAYLMPIAFLAVVVTVRLTGSRWMLALPLLAMVASSYSLMYPERASPDRVFGQTAAAFLRNHDVRLVVGDSAEFEGAFEVLLPMAADDEVRGRLLSMEQVILRAQLEGANADALALYFHPAVAGKRSLLTTKAVARLRAEGGLFAKCIDDVMPKIYEFEEFRFATPYGAGLDGFWLDPRL